MFQFARFSDSFGEGLCRWNIYCFV